jgi:hypothetical protein
MNVVIRGPLLSISGYGVHARQVFAWAYSKGWNINCHVLPWGITPFYIDPDKQNGLIGKVMEKTAPFPAQMPIDLSLQIQLPNEWDPNLARVNIGITAGVETTACSQEWIDACNRMDHIVVPSTFTRNLFIRHGLKEEKISAIPEAFTCDFRETKGSQKLLSGLDKLPTEFNFLIFGQITGTSPETDRKNTFYNIKWLCELFANDPDVGVIVKTNMGRLTVRDREDSTNMLKEVVSQVRQGPYPKFYLAHGLMDESEITSLYKSENVKALVAPTRGEGWGLPILDAAVCGLPIIATNWSGHLDFLKSVKFLSLDYDLVAVHPDKIDGSIFVEGCQWAEVRESHFKSRLNKFRNGSSLPTQWATQAAPHVTENFNLTKIFSIYDEKLGGLIDGS